MASNHQDQTGDAAHHTPALEFLCGPGAHACAVAAPEVTDDLRLALQLEKLALSTPPQAPQLQSGTVVVGFLFNCEPFCKAAFVTVQGHLVAGRGMVTAGEQVIGECFYVPANSPVLMDDPLAVGTRAMAILCRADPPRQLVGQILLTSVPNAQLLTLKFNGGSASLRCQFC